MNIKRIPGITSRRGLEAKCTLTVQDFVNISLGTSPFGDTAYKTPSNEMLIKKTPGGRADKLKKISFVEHASKKKSWIPGPIYNREIKWNGVLPANAGKFKKKARYLISEDIGNAQRKFKHPGPSSYQNENGWRSNSKFLNSTIGCSKIIDDRTSFVEQPSQIVLDIPSPDKYVPIPIERYLTKTSVLTKIPVTHMPRFKPLQKNLHPAPTSYYPEDSITKSQWQTTKYSVGKDKTPRSYFHNAAARQKNPGPGLY